MLLVPQWALAMPVEDGFEGQALATMYAGGSNYHWFHDDGRCSPTSRERWGILKRYHEVDPVLGPVRNVVRRQLRAMHKRGMRRLSLGVYFMHQPASDSGTLVDSSSPQAVARAALNLRMLLADVRNTGYEEVLFRFFPTANINPSQPQFPHRDSADYWPRVDEYWNLVEALRPALAESGLPYRIDLMVEGAPRDSNSVVYPENQRYKYPANVGWSRAVRDLWQRYVSRWGSDDTVGFSFLIDDDHNRMRSRVRHMRYVYEGVYPHLFALDIYAGEDHDEYAKFMLMDEHMRAQNPGNAHWDQAGWIIAEAHYEDPLAAEALVEAITDSSRTVFFLTQWPLDRAATCQLEQVNVAPPFDWLVWSGYGF